MLRLLWLGFLLHIAESIISRRKTSGVRRGQGTYLIAPLRFVNRLVCRFRVFRIFGNLYQIVENG